MNRGRTPEDAIDALKGKVVRLIIPTYQLANYNHPDPAVARNPFSFQAERATCAPLLGYPDAPPPAGQRLVPEAATAMPTLSPDRRTYTFTVRKGFRFAPPSNAPLDARTFRYSIERALDRRLGTNAPGIQFLGDLEGAQAFHAGRLAHVAGIHVRGDRISFTLVAPSPDFLERLTLPYFCPVPRTTPILLGGVNFAPPGAGPYTFSGAIVNGAYAILKRNANYGGSRPQRLDAIAFREGIDTEKAVARVESGRWEAVEHFDPLLAPGGVVARGLSVKGSHAPSYRAFPRPLILYLALDARHPPFSDARLRRAVAAALNRHELAAFWNQTAEGITRAGQGALQFAATGVRATDRILPPSVRGAARPTGSRPTGQRFSTRLRRRRLVARMAVQRGDERQRRFAQIVDAQLAPLGIDLRLVLVDDVLEALRNPATHIQLAALRTELEYPDPASFLAQMLGKDVPNAWLPLSTRLAVDRLASMTGAARDRAALSLAERLAAGDSSIIAYGTPTLGAVLGRRLSCRVWNGVDQGLDLAAICVRH